LSTEAFTNTPTAGDPRIEDAANSWRTIGGFDVAGLF
jgi:hypothetical protein